MRALLERIEEAYEIKDAKARLDLGETVHFEGCSLIHKAVLIRLLTKGTGIVVTPTSASARALCETLASFTDEVQLFPAKDGLLDKLSLKSEADHHQRLRVLSMLSEGRSCIVVLPASALRDRYPSIEDLRGSELRIRSSDTVSMDELQERLETLGYERVSMTELTGQYSIRGGLIDIFPVQNNHPVRLDLFGEEITRLCLYDEVSQLSMEDIDSVRILSAGGTDPTERTEETASIRDYLPKDGRFFFDEPSAILDEMKKEEGSDSKEPSFTSMDLSYGMGKASGICLSLLPDSNGRSPSYSMQTVGLSGFKGRLPELWEALKSYSGKGYQIAVLIPNAAKAQRLAKDANERGLSAYVAASDEGELYKGRVTFYSAYLSEGIEYPDLKLVIVTDNDIFGKRLLRKKKRRYRSEAVEGFFDLHEGDLVVHEDYGLGRYLGTAKQTTDGSMKDYLKIEYAKNSLLYIPVAQMDRIQKYISKENAKGTVKLNRLDGKEWERTKQAVKKNVEEVAARLMELYALREESPGFAFSKDSIWQSEFEDGFPYEETKAQLQTIAEVKRDMESDRVMDRLICGDVGFGKTEIAIRAAFKAIQDGKQVAYLVPTTVLAMQHYKTFCERLSDYPVHVELLCRIRTPLMQKGVIADLKSGAADIVIGTHRLLSKDVDFKDLGLLIVDEEQRFGVSDKEKLKELKQGVDVLTLTATPIPRTLHMSMIGVRDISILNDPPSNRLPVNTYACPYDEDLIVSGIRRELERSGQVFFVYNRVNTIADMANRLQALIPEATIAYAHGQMSAKELEAIMVEFESGEIDVLVSTTIIETGIDIPNVNTMIIADAHRFGLSGLYQLRGRIGRSDREAYAYLLYPPNRILKEEAQKRLHAIREFSQLGSGYRIAMKDLELRGEGNIFGFEQSGHIGAVGYELYCKMLKIAIADRKQEKKTGLLYNTSIEIPMNAYLSDGYIEDERTRIELYKRIAMIESLEDKKAMEEELIDRFGPIPNAAKSLLRVSYLRARANKVYVTVIKQQDASLIFELYEKAALDVSRIEETVAEYNLELARQKDKENPRLNDKGARTYRHRYYNTLRFMPKGRTCFVHKIRQDDNLYEIIEKVIDVIGLLVIELE